MTFEELRKVAGSAAERQGGKSYDYIRAMCLIQIAQELNEIKWVLMDIRDGKREERKDV